MKARPLGPPSAAREGAARWARKPGDLAPTTKPTSPRGKGWLHMPIHRIRALCAGILLVCAASASAASPINVHIRVEGAHKTLITQRTVTLADAPIPPKDGNPDHTCP